MATTIFDVVDHLIATYTALPGLGALVVDAFPGPDRPDLIVSVGGAVEPTTDAIEAWANLGARQVEEEYRVRCYVSSFTGGGEAKDQKAARDAARAAFDAIYAYHRGDLTLGGLVRQAEVDTVSLVQTNELSARSGRLAEIHFAVHAAARI